MSRLFHSSCLVLKSLGGVPLPHPIARCLALHLPYLLIRYNAVSISAFVYFKRRSSFPAMPIHAPALRRRKRTSLDLLLLFIYMQFFLKKKSTSFYSPISEQMVNLFDSLLRMCQDFSGKGDLGGPGDG